MILEWHPKRLLKTSRAFCLVCFISLMQSFIDAHPSSDKVHSRQKRLLWVTSDGRLALPPGTTLVVNPSLSVPLVRYPPDGFFSNLTVSLPFTIDFDKLGLTDNENPYGVVPPLLARSLGTEIGDILESYVNSYMSHRRGKRAGSELHSQIFQAFRGGERALLYTVIEDFLENFGVNGKACLLRAICEVHAHPMHNYGLIGEILKLFFTASKSPYSTILKEYVDAENAGSRKSGPSECWPYMKDCPKSLFKSRHNYFSKDVDENDNETKVQENSEDNPGVTYQLNKVKNM